MISGIMRSFVKAQTSARIQYIAVKMRASCLDWELVEKLGVPEIQSTSQRF